MPVKADDGGRSIARRLAYQIDQQTLAKLRLIVLHAGRGADRVQHLLRPVGDPLLLGADEADEAQRLVLHQLLADAMGVEFRIRQECQGGHQGDRDDGE